ncbi:putative RNA helicase-1 [Toxoplasma gondii RUB]|uniref:RNA helicase-1 n=6 Tax=Toxoplasma gondii TaxID=5811 RepID=S7UNR8_TOXGG|nr:hypothetical protein TGGT1_210370 [Toxoplasma gondii GT1]KAF4644647.1 hypothetical protein TGRH88_016410 [Toxoplasma gondii]KFG29646.1 putative RNA helicase-1 [Toxoplasma gondii GAB2-2007-GAL-DOM2]KFG33284.1 putative RNA helicase-1 [Toxoplasma gondii FOU]KFG62957.1 putative RNA helicase-1 [Toxoplasma gondii RUB]RQX73510.1 putative RNA helicase-1 [Toxoplasma gondii CAST]
MATVPMVSLSAARFTLSFLFFQLCLSRLFRPEGRNELEGPKDVDADVIRALDLASVFAFAEAVNNPPPLEGASVSPENATDPPETGGSRRWRTARYVLRRPFTHIRRVSSAFRRYISRGTSSLASSFAWKRRLRKLIRGMAKDLKQNRVRDAQQKPGSDAVASFVKTPHALLTSLGTPPAELANAVGLLLPVQHPVPMKSKVTGKSLLVSHAATVGVSSYGSVLLRCEGSGESASYFLEAFPVLRGSREASVSVRKQYLAAIKELRAASGVAQVGVVVDLLLLKRVRNTWCPRPHESHFAFPNVFLKRAVEGETLREVLLHIASTAATDTPGTGPAHDARVSLTEQVHKLARSAAELGSRGGKINIDTFFVTLDGIVHLQPVSLVESPPVHRGSAGLESPIAAELEEGEEKPSPEKRMTDDLALAIVLAQIWCPQRRFDDVAYELLLLHRFEREVTEEFFERCADPPEAVQVLVTMLAF